MTEYTRTVKARLRLGESNESGWVMPIFEDPRVMHWQVRTVMARVQMWCDEDMTPENRRPSSLEPAGAWLVRVAAAEPRWSVCSICSFGFLEMEAVIKRKAPPPLTDSCHARVDSEGGHCAHWSAAGDLVCCWCGERFVPSTANGHAHGKHQP